ncbi:MAG: glycosyltransferase family 4 protein [bacterium]|nr:glycosyltransferase family 4 protein [bacterium]
MKILLIFPLCPLPANSGGQVRVWNIAKQLSKNHTVDLLCFIRNESEKKYQTELLTVFNSVQFIVRKELFDRSALVAGDMSFISFFVSNLSVLISTLFSDRPLLSHLYDSPELRNAVVLADENHSYNLFYAETFYGISSLKDILTLLKTKILLIDQNIESIAYDRQAYQQKNLIVRMLMKLDVLKIRREEEFYWKKTGAIGALSGTDQKYIVERTGREVILVENGVDSAWFAEHKVERTASEVLFVGTFSYFQNVDSLHWFLDDLWPLISSKSSKPLTLRIVGRGADDSLKRYVKDKGQEIDENVDDIRIAFQHATVLAAPIRAGSGTKYKVLEAMASRLPIVTTLVGAEGLAVTSGNQLFIAADESEFVLDILALTDDDSLRSTVGNSGYLFVKDSYDWTTIVDGFNKILNASSESNF